MPYLYIFIILALIIIIGMASYAGMLLLALNKRKKHIRKNKNERLEYFDNSVLIIAKAMRADECNLSEGVIRLHALLPTLNKDLGNYKAMKQLYTIVMDMPTHEKRNVLPRNQRMRIDLTREAAEAELESRIKLELSGLLSDMQIKERK